MSSYNNKSDLLSLLKSQQIFPKKKLGQNFLINHSILQTIQDEAGLNENDYIVEIGPGLGILTYELAKIARKVETIEIDQKLIPYLKKNFSQHKNITLIEADALKINLPHQPYKLIANIPYYITSPLLNHFLSPQNAAELRPTLMILLVQKEVAEKICAKEGNHSILSLQVQIFGKPKIIRKVPASSFYPAPKVDSALLKIDVYPEPLLRKTELFFKTIKIAFSQKRKTLLNSLEAGLQLPKENILQILKKVVIDKDRRPQTLKIEEWEKLIDNLYS